MKSNTSNTILIAFISFMSCKSAKPDLNTVTVGPLSISANKKWRYANENGIDSEVKLLVLNNKDTLTLEYGKHVNALNEDLPSIMSLQDKRQFDSLAGRKVEINKLIISDMAEDEMKYGLFLNNYYMYDTINGIQVKVVQPKKVKKGITGIYIAKLKDGNSFVAYGINLDSTAQKEAMKIFQSITYN